MAFMPAIGRALPRLGARALPMVATRAPRRPPPAAAARASASAGSPSVSPSASSPTSPPPSPPTGAADGAAAVTPDTVQWVARLAHLRLSDDEAAGMVDIFGEMLAFVQQVADADVSDIEASAAAGGGGGGGGGGGDDAAVAAAVEAEALAKGGVVDAPWLRPDLPVTFEANEELLAEAPELEDDLFRVPRIMDAEA
ncbi:hypothetical protein MMPV_003860 [Pyropia vietnamensis]